MSISLNTLELVGLNVQTVLAEMEETFPPVNPTPQDSTAKIMYQSGQRSVVEWLQEKLKENGI
jgi:hypothetical protein